MWYVPSIFCFINEETEAQRFSNLPKVTFAGKEVEPGFNLRHGFQVFSLRINSMYFKNNFINWV